MPGQMGRRVAVTGPPLKGVRRHGPNLLLVFVERLECECRRNVVDSDARERLERRRAYWWTQIASPVGERWTAPPGPAHPQSTCVVHAVCLVRLREFEQKWLGVGAERRQRRRPTAAVQRGIVEADDDGRQRRRISHVGERVERCGANLRPRIVKRGDDRRGALANLDQTQRTQSERAPPPPHASQVPVRERNERQFIRDDARPRNTCRPPISNQWRHQQPRNGRPKPTGTHGKRPGGAVVSGERALDERLIAALDAAKAHADQRDGRALDDDGRQRRGGERDRRPEHHGCETRGVNHGKNWATETVKRSTVVSLDRHWCSHVVFRSVFDGTLIRIPAATVVASSERRRSAVRSSKLSMP